ADLIEYLRGEDGVDGEDGADGTDGIDGQDGADGTNGKSALELLIDAGELPDGSDAADLAAYLKGETGAAGQDGEDGLDGDNIPFVNILEGDDAYISGSDLNEEGKIDVAIALPDDAQVNDTLIVNGVNTTITQDMIDNGFITSLDVPDSGTLFVRATVEYADGSISGTGKDFARVGIIARDDADELDLGDLQIAQIPVYTNETYDLLNLAEGTDGSEGALPFTVSESSNGMVDIEVSQTALVTIADAIRIEVYDSNGDQVYAGTTGVNPLVGDVVGLELLGLTGNDTLTATVSGLEPGDYTIVVGNDEGVLGTLVEDITLAELGEAGVVLGAENQTAVLDVVETALNDPILGLDLGLGTLVRVPLEIILDGTEDIGVGDLVGIITGNAVINGLLDGVVDPLLDAIADALLSNTLTLLETTNITATLAEFDYADGAQVTGNVIDPDAGIEGEDGEDTVTSTTVLTAISSDNVSESVPTSTEVGGVEVFTIAGQYGVLVIDENGEYTYTANGDYASAGQTETFTYTIASGIGSDTAELVIELDDMTAPDAPTIDTPIAIDDVVNTQEAAEGFNVTGTGEPGATITLTNEAYDVIGTATVGANGVWSVPIDQADVDAMGQESETLSATATDPSGNESSAVTTDITVDTVAPTANNDQDYAGLVENPVTTSPSYSGTAGGLLSLNALDAIDLDLLSTKSVFQVTVTAAQELSLTLDGNGSVGFNLALGSKDFSLSVYKVVSGEEDDITLVQQENNWLEYSPFGLGGSWSADNLSLPTLTGGADADGKDATYYFLLGSSNDNFLGVSLGSAINVTTVDSELIDYDSVPTTGNVITNNDVDAHIVTVVDSVDVDGSTTIQGTYGTLVIGEDGAYTYTPTEDIDVIGETDSFEYTIEDVSGNTAIATLEVTISDGTPPAAGARMTSDSDFTVADDEASIELPDTSMTSSKGLDTLSFESADQNISLADILEPEVIDIIDISGTGANTLNVAAEDIESDIYVTGDADDTVNLDGDNWSSVRQTVSEGEEYNLWQSGTDISTQIYIDTDITNVI
ncbi:Ig-like domain-containing protein, partial [Psychrobacter sp. AOP7-A1-24]|uniref:Ig-like domain-containing protein n=1 Tax=Psychrobacter sp. AOP7-A1-24 TaxID=3457646 RepID=UPI00402B5B2A